MAMASQSSDLFELVGFPFTLNAAAMLMFLCD